MRTESLFRHDAEADLRVEEVEVLRADMPFRPRPPLQVGQPRSGFKLVDVGFPAPGKALHHLPLPEANVHWLELHSGGSSELACRESDIAPACATLGRMPEHQPFSG